jgi:mRNA interferase MazF
LEKSSGKHFYIPDVGDIVIIDFNPQVGREQAKRRPAICISPKEYNEKSQLAIFCPITSKKKGIHLK